LAGGSVDQSLNNHIDIGKKQGELQMQINCGEETTESTVFDVETAVFESGPAVFEPGETIFEVGITEVVVESIIGT